MELSKQQMDLAQKQFGLSQSQFEYLKQQAGDELAFARQQSDRDYALQQRALDGDADMRKISAGVADAQMGLMNQTAEYARRDRQRYEDKFLPMQDQFINEANNYDSGARRDAESSRAMVDVQRQADAQRSNADMQMRSMGIDPSQMRSGSMLNQMQVGMAAQQAAAGNNARQGVEDRGRAMRADALNLGMGLPTQAMQGFATSSNAGGAAAGAAGNAAQISAQGFANYNALANSGVAMRGNALQSYGALTGTGLDWNNAGQQATGMAGQFAQMQGNLQQQGFENKFNRWQGRQAQWQRWFDNAATTAQTVAQFMSAEGGHVSRQNFADGGAVRLPRRQNFIDGGAIMSMVGSMMGGKKDDKGGGDTGQVAVADPGTAAAGSSTPPPQAAAAPAAVQAPAASAPQPFQPTEAQIQQYGNPGATVDQPTMSFSDKLKTAWAEPAKPGSTSGGSARASQAPAQIIPNQNGKAFDNVGFSAHPQVQFASEGAAMAGHPHMGQPTGHGMAVPRRQARDTVPAMLSEGEYVIPADVVHSKGLEFFDKLVAKYHRPGA